MSFSKFTDTPIEKSEHESLGVKKYADVLAKFIVGCESPITIGIQGDWGIGKTSMLNMVQHKLKQHTRGQQNYYTIYFNTWQYSQFNTEEFLGLSILKGIIAEIRSLDPLKDGQKAELFKKSLSSFGGFVVNLGNQVAKKQVGVDIKKAAGDIGSEDSLKFLDEDIVSYIKKMKEEFAKLVKTLCVNERDRLVIMIDDLDRIKPVKALEFLEAIKNFLDVEYCIFLIAVDYSVIQSGMEEKLGRSAQELQGKSYFDKIIQVPFSMPAASYQTDRYIMSLLGWDYSDEKGAYYKIQEEERFFLTVKENRLESKDVDFFTNITGLTVGNNPRSIKRAINYANLLRLIVVNEREGSGERWALEEAKTLYSLSCMQLAWPELFVHFSDTPNPATLSRMQDFEYLESLQGMDVLFKRVHNPDEVKSNITGFIDELISLIDTNEDGQVSSEEFKPIWKMMSQANLTTSKHQDVEEQWDTLKVRINECMGSKGDADLVESILALFRGSDSMWNDPDDFDLLSAGKRFVTITWGKKQVGTIATTKINPATLYLKGTYDKYLEILPEDVHPYLEDVSNQRHFGTGDVKVDIMTLAKSSDGISAMNAILKAMQSQLFRNK